MCILTCPVCRAPLQKDGARCVCANGHSFDFAKEGYVNLLPANRHRSRTPGDAPELIRARRAFLDAGYYAPLRDLLTERLTGGVVLDACCGEGYYTSAAAAKAEHMYGFDIAKDAVRYAAKRDKATTYFVAGLHDIPVQTHAVDTLLHLFAPFEDGEFRRVLRQDGTLVHVLPGERHLMGLKSVLYDKPYRNAETPPQTGMTLCGADRLRCTVTLRTNDDVRNLFSMTPYVYKTSPDDAARLLTLDRLETELDFVILTYRNA